jgi:hypothetical protein
MLRLDNPGATGADVTTDLLARPVTDTVQAALRSLIERRIWLISMISTSSRPGNHAAELVSVCDALDRLKSLSPPVHGNKW